MIVYLIMYLSPRGQLIGGGKGNEQKNHKKCPKEFWANRKRGGNLYLPCQTWNSICRRNLKTNQNAQT
jgi:hypothetical protein